MAKQKSVINIPDDLTKEERNNLADDIIDFIRERTGLRGIGYNPETGRNYSLSSKPYTEKYAAKKGVGENQVDLFLSGDMLEAIEPIKITKSAITIGFNDKEQNDKAEGNQLGSYGGDPNPKKARPFLGISAKDLREILKEYE